jgi:hypothetical protein
MSKRKPRITPARQGGAFDGVFDPPSPDASAEAPAKQPAAKRLGTPQPGDPAHDRTVQANWNVPAWLRAKVRAVKDFDGTSQNEVVAAALERYVAELEEGRGEPYPVQARHFE